MGWSTPGTPAERRGGLGGAAQHPAKARSSERSGIHQKVPAGGDGQVLGGGLQGDAEAQLAQTLDIVPAEAVAGEAVEVVGP